MRASGANAERTGRSELAEAKERVGRQRSNTALGFGGTMAQLTVHGNWKSIFALASLVAMIGVTAYAVVAHDSIGIWLYAFSLLAMIFGFWSKEDHLAIGGIMGFFTVMMLDIVLRVGLMGFTECKPNFSAIFGCP